MRRIRQYLVLSFMIMGVAFTVGAQTLTVIKQKDKFGYADADGNVVIKPAFTKAFAFENGRAKVQKGDKWGYIDSSGKPIIKIEYDNIEDFKNGIALVKKGNKYGYIREDGSIYIKPDYNFIGSFNEDGYIWVGKGRSVKESLKGLYRNDKLIVPVAYGSLGFYVKTDSVDYTAGNPVSITNGVPDTNEINEAFSKLSTSSEPYIWATQFVTTTIFDKDGNKLTKPISGVAVGMPKDGFCLTRKYGMKGKDQTYKYNYIATDGKNTKLFKKDIVQVLDMTDLYESCQPFNNGMAVCGTHQEAHMIDKTGRQLGSSYSSIRRLGSNGYIVKSNGLMGVLDNYAKETVAPTYLSLTPADKSCNILNATNSQSKCGMIDILGKEIIPFRFDMTTAYVGDKAYVKEGGFYGVIDRNGNYVVKNQWTDILPAAECFDEIIWVQSPSTNKWLPVSMVADKKAFDLEVDKAFQFDGKGRSVITIGETIGAVDKNGAQVLPLLFSDDRIAFKALDYIDGLDKPKMEEIDAYRFNIYNNPSLNTYRLHQKIDNFMWDY